MDLRLKNYSSPLESLDLGKSLNCCPNKVCDDTCTVEQALKYECASDWPVYPIVGGTLGATGLDVHNCMSQLQVTFSEKGTKMTSQLHILHFEILSLSNKIHKKTLTCCL